MFRSLLLVFTGTSDRTTQRQVNRPDKLIDRPSIVNLSLIWQAWQIAGQKSRWSPDNPSTNFDSAGNHGFRPERLVALRKLPAHATAPPGPRSVKKSRSGRHRHE